MLHDILVTMKICNQWVSSDKEILIVGVVFSWFLGRWGPGAIAKLSELLPFMPKPILVLLDCVLITILSMLVVFYFIGPVTERDAFFWGLGSSLVFSAIFNVFGKISLPLGT